MNIPDFDAFLSDVGADRRARWTDAANELRQVIVLPITEHNVNDFIQAITSANFAIVTEMMRDYHAWLIEQLETNSIHPV